MNKKRSLSKITKEEAMSQKEHIPWRLKLDSGRIPSDVKPLVFPIPEETIPAPQSIKSHRIYPNRQAHKEFQTLNVSAGLNSVLMKQLEIHEELFRALIEIQINGLPEDIKTEMLKKYENLI